MVWPCFGATGMARVLGKWRNLPARQKKRSSGCLRERVKTSAGGGTMPEADVDKVFRSLLSVPHEMTDQAPASLKARLYSAFFRRQQDSGPLAILDANVTVAHGTC